MDRLVTPDRNTIWAFFAALMVENSGLVVPRGYAQPRHDRLTERQVTVSFYEARHYPLVGSVYSFNVFPVFDINLRRDRPNAEDAVALHHNSVVLDCWLACRVNEGAVTDYRGLCAIGAHGLLLWYLFHFEE